MNITVDGEQATKDLGQKIGSRLKGGEVFQLIGDVGAGKTTFTKGLALGMGVTEDVQSPSFTISRVYDAPASPIADLQLAHYDFYRLNDAGIMASELTEAINDPLTVTIIEWADIVAGVLPSDVITINFSSPTDNSRLLEVSDDFKDLFA